MSEVVRFHCPFVGLCGCRDGDNKGLFKSSLRIHLRDFHCSGDARAITRQALTTNLSIFNEAEITFKRMGIWLCGVCYKTNVLSRKCVHGRDSVVAPPDCGDGVVSFILYDFPKPLDQSPSSSGANVEHDVSSLNVALLDRLWAKGF